MSDLDVRDRSPWASHDAACPTCSTPVPQAELEQAQYGLSFDEWKHRDDERRRVRVTPGYGDTVQQLLISGTSMREDVGRTWLHVTCAGCGERLRIQNPQVSSPRRAFLTGVAIGSCIALAGAAAWLAVLRPWDRVT